MQSDNVGRTSLDSDYAANLLADVVAILRACGKSDAEIGATIAAALRTPRQSDIELRELNRSAEFHLACCQIVFRWRHDSRYVDRSGVPLKLTAGGSPPAFSSLIVDAHLGTRDEYLGYLEALGVVKRTSDGLIELLTDSVLACSGRKGLSVSSQTVLSHLVDFVSTVRFNLERKEANDSGRFERACFGRVSESYIPILRRLTDERGQTFIDGVDEWLARHSSSNPEAKDMSLVGVGAYMYVRGRD